MGLRTLPNAVVDVVTGGGKAAELMAADQGRLRRYQEYLDFYSGKQWERERRGRSNLVLNYCRTVVDKGVSYLLGRGVNFAVVPEEDRNRRLAQMSAERDEGQEGKTRGGKVDAEEAERLIYRVYDDCQLEAVDAQAATNGAVLGDTVFKVFWQGSGEKGERRDGARVRVVSVDPMRFFAEWAEDDLGTLVRAHCMYSLSAEQVGRRFGEGVTRAGRGGAQGPALQDQRGRVPVMETWTDASFEVWVGEKQVVAEANPYGFIPFVHIPNARPANEFWGVSDLRDIVPLNRELNERFSDMADVIRFHADPPVIFKGISEHTNMGVGPGTVWDVPQDAEVELLEWRGSQPAVFDHIDRVMRALHDIAETPKTAFGEVGRIQSGVALEVELQSLIQKTMRKRAWWSAGLKRRNWMILRIGEQMGLGHFAPYRSKVVWPPLLPSDTEAEVANNVALVEAGLRSRETALDRLGEESPEEEMGRIALDARGQGSGVRGQGGAGKPQITQMGADRAEDRQ